MSLQFFVSHKGDVAVVSFAGEMTLGSLGVLDDCRVKLETMPVRFLVLNMTEVSKITEEALRPLALIQNIARKSQCTLRVCGLRGDIARFLMSRGAIRSNELKGNLVDCLKTLEFKQVA